MGIIANSKTNSEPQMQALFTMNHFPKRLVILFVLFFPIEVLSSESITIEDLKGVWLDNGDYTTRKSDQKSGVVFKPNGDAFIIGNDDLICPRDKIKNIDGVFHISCFVDEKFEYIRLVVAGWKSGNKRLLFGFHYWLADTDRILGKTSKNDPQNYRIFDGEPITLEWVEDKE